MFVCLFLFGFVLNKTQTPKAKKRGIEAVSELEVRATGLCSRPAKRVRIALAEQGQRRQTAWPLAGSSTPARRREPGCPGPRSRRPASRPGCSPLARGFGALPLRRYSLKSGRQAAAPAWRPDRQRRRVFFFQSCSLSHEQQFIGLKLSNSASLISSFSCWLHRLSLIFLKFGGGGWRETEAIGNIWGSFSLPT